MPMNKEGAKPHSFRDIEGIDISVNRRGQFMRMFKGLRSEGGEHKYPRSKSIVRLENTPIDLNFWSRKKTRETNSARLLFRRDGFSVEIISKDKEDEDGFRSNETRFLLAEILTQLNLDRQLVKKILAVVEQPHNFLARDQGEAELDALENLGISVVDLRVCAVSSLNNWHDSLRALRCIWGSTWLISLFGPITDGDWALSENRSFTIPARPREVTVGESHVDFVAGFTGHDRVTRQVQELLKTIDWSANAVLRGGLETWERDLFSDVYSEITLEKLQRLEKRLARMALSAKIIRESEADLKHRAANRNVFTHTAKSIIEKSCVDIRDTLQLLRADVRNSFILLETVSSGWQAAQEKVRQQEAAARYERERYAEKERNRLVGLITSMVLVPSLVIALYSADVQGIPGKSTFYGLIFLTIFSVIGGWITFRKFKSKDDL